MFEMVEAFFFFLRVCCTFVVWQQAGGKIKDRALSQQREAAAAARSWFKPLPNQGSTFISRCHYSPAALWQMALWDIGFYGRSSFISNFFSHLMRSSRSSQIQFAVWILIELCTLPLSPPCSLSLPLLSCRRLLQGSDLMASCSWFSAWDGRACLFGVQHTTVKKNHE